MALAGPANAAAAAIAQSSDAVFISYSLTWHFPWVDDKTDLSGDKAARSRPRGRDFGAAREHPRRVRVRRAGNVPRLARQHAVAPNVRRPDDAAQQMSVYLTTRCKTEREKIANAIVIYRQIFAGTIVALQSPMRAVCQFAEMAQCTGRRGPTIEVVAGAMFHRNVMERGPSGIAGAWQWIAGCCAFSGFDRR